VYQLRSVPHVIWLVYKQVKNTTKKLKCVFCKFVITDIIYQLFGLILWF